MATQMSTAEAKGYSEDYTARFRVGRTIWWVVGIEEKEGYHYISLESGKNKTKCATLRHTFPERPRYLSYWFQTEKQAYGGWIQHYEWLSDEYKETKPERYRSTQAKCAAMIRKDLKEAFPGTSFSVKSEGFSMGDAVNVRWTDGPTSDRVKNLVGKYEYGHFNGMEDIYEYSNSRDDIPQTKYLFCRRDISNPRVIQAKKEIMEKYADAKNCTLESFDTTMICNEWGSSFVRRYIREQEEELEKWQDKQEDIETIGRIARNEKGAAMSSEDPNLLNISGILAEIEVRVAV